MEKTRLWVDGHVDWPYYIAQQVAAGVAQPPLGRPFSPSLARRAGVRLFGTALYCEDVFNGKEAAGHLRKRLELTLGQLENIRLIGSREDLLDLKRDGSVLGTFLILENADAVADDPSALQKLRRKGVLLVGLTHAGKNRLAQGNAVEDASGLTAAGRRALKALPSLGMALDAAHLHPRCFREMADSFEGLLVTSHTGIREICNLRRNLDLAQAAEIVRRRGVIGITFNPEMLTFEKSCSVEDVFRHVDILVQRFGPGSIALGSDFFGFEPVCAGLEDIGSLAALAAYMKARGYSRPVVDQVMGGNWLRFLDELLSRAPLR